MVDLMNFFVMILYFVEHNILVVLWGYNRKWELEHRVDYLIPMMVDSFDSWEHNRVDGNTWWECHKENRGRMDYRMDYRMA